MRTAVTIIQTEGGSTLWATAMEPSCDPQEHRDFLKSLPPGDQVGLVMETNGRGKRRKVSWSPAGPATKKRGRPRAAKN